MITTINAQLAHRILQEQVSEQQARLVVAAYEQDRDMIYEDWDGRRFRVKIMGIRKLVDRLFSVSVRVSGPDLPFFSDVVGDRVGEAVLHPDRLQCAHDNTVRDETGGLRLSGGDLHDTRRVSVICLDCGQNLGEE